MIIRTGGVKPLGYSLLLILIGYLTPLDCMASSLPLSSLRTISIKLKAAQSALEARLLLQALNGVSLWNTTGGCPPLQCRAQAAADYRDATNAVSRQLVANIGRWSELAQETVTMMRGWHYLNTPPLDVQQTNKQKNASPYDFRRYTSYPAMTYPKAVTATGATVQSADARAAINDTVAKLPTPVVSPGRDHQQGSMLLAQAIALRDAPNEQAAKVVLQRLKDANIDVFGLPCEDLDCHTQIPKVYAATIDTLLLELASVIHRWPDLAQEVGRIILSWQYCDIRYRNRSRDLVYLQYQTKRMAASGSSPVAGQGWQAWGFEEHDDQQRLIPYPARHHGLGGNAKAEFLHRYIHQRCFPNPDTGRTPYDPTEPMYSGPTHDFPDQQGGGTYPYLQQWRAAPVAVSTPIDTKEPATPGKKLKHENPAQKVTTLEPKKTDVPALKPPTPATIAAAKAAPLAVKKPDHSPLLTPQDANPLPVAEDEKRHPIHPRRGVAVRDSKDQTPNSAEQDPNAVSKRFQGDVHTKWKLQTAQAELGVNGLWNPFSYFYLRGGVSARLPARHSNPAYTWGLGYNDWHPGGWVVEFNQWNPQQLGLGNTIKNAEFNLAYRMPLAPSWEPYLSGTLNAGLTGKTPNLGTQWQFKYQDYFARVGVNKNLRGLGGWQWTYGFGHWNWRAGSLNIEYANWGSNRAFQPNYRRNGEIILEYRWDY